MSILKILTLDIETSPNLADVWDLWNQNVSLNQLRETSKILCVGAKWHDSRAVNFWSEWGSEDMISEVWEVIDAADVLVTFNGDRFDLPTLNREFIMSGLGPPDSYESVDLYKICRRRFKFASFKLDHIAQQLGVGAKVKHEGHTMWVKVMAGDPKAQKAMEKYCKGDVIPTERLYNKILPWIDNHPNRNLYDGGLCTRCPLGVLVKRGFYYAATGKYQTYRCSSCGGYQRDTRRIDSVSIRGM